MVITISNERVSVHHIVKRNYTQNRALEKGTSPQLWDFLQLRSW